MALLPNTHPLLSLLLASLGCPVDISNFACPRVTSRSPEHSNPFYTVFPSSVDGNSILPVLWKNSDVHWVFVFLSHPTSNLSPLLSASQIYPESRHFLPWPKPLSSLSWSLFLRSDLAM
jgi:hypothetical protein